ncbi:uncharacterized protein NH340_JMT05454 [Sarcoptes scabiei]|nr:uncharacterized protein NH340_JMT05454 [Sarcoptes scabiei]
MKQIEVKQEGMLLATDDNRSRSFETSFQKECSKKNVPFGTDRFPLVFFCRYYVLFWNRQDRMPQTSSSLISIDYIINRQRSNRNRIQNKCKFLRKVTKHLWSI